MDNMTPETPAPQNTAPLQPNQQNSNLMAALAYVLGFISGIIVYLIGKDKVAKFHGLQSILFSVFMYVVYYILGYLPGLWVLQGPIGLISFIISIFLIVKAYKGEMYKLPVLGDLAAKHS